MKKLMDRINIRNLVIIILCITVILMAIGFSVLSMKLNVDDPYYNVEFTKIEQTSSVKGGSINPDSTYKIKSSGQRVNFNFQLNNPYDEIIYKLTIKNKGNMPVEIKDIVEYPEYSTDLKAKEKIYPVKISYNDVVDTVLEAGQSTEINLVVQYAMGEKAKKDIDYSLVLVTSSPKE